MAIAFDAVSSLTAGNETTLTLAHTIGAGSNRILFVGAMTQKTTVHGTVSATYNGVAMTLIDAQANSDDTAKSYLFYLVNPDEGNHNIVFTNDTTQYVVMAGGVSYSGVLQTGQPDSTSKTTDDSSPYDVTVTTVADNCWVVGMFAQNWYSGTPTAGTGTTIRTSLNDMALTDNNAAKTPAGNVTLEITTVSARKMAIVAASFKPYVVPSGPINVKTINGLAKASVSKINGLEIASVKSVNGLT